MESPYDNKPSNVWPFCVKNKVAFLLAPIGDDAGGRVQKEETPERSRRRSSGFSPSKFQIPCFSGSGLICDLQSFRDKYAQQNIGRHRCVALNSNDFSKQKGIWQIVG